MRQIWSNRIGRYASRTKFIELFINRDDRVITDSDYVGVYVLMEKVKQGAQRVAVSSLTDSDNEEPDVSGGYLLEKGWDFYQEI